MGLISVNVFINDLDDRADYMPGKFTGVKKTVGGVSDIPDSYAAIQRDLNRLEKLSDKKLIRFPQQMEIAGPISGEE